jgi:two-component system response regulator (stage 0 sporulation protein A)
VVVTELMHEMGIPAHVKGYQYLRDAILRALSDESLANNITKELYPKVADKYNTTPDRVERGIRHAIELAWVRGNVDLMTDYFGYTINLQKGKPTNAEFIAMVSDRIRLNY